MSMSWGPSILNIAAVNTRRLEDLAQDDDSSSLGSDDKDDEDEDAEDAEVIDLLEDFGMLNPTANSEDEVERSSDVAEIYVARKRHRVQ